MYEKSYKLIKKKFLLNKQKKEILYSFIFTNKIYKTNWFLHLKKYKTNKNYTIVLKV